MNKKILLIFLFVAGSCQLLAQDILWEKKFGWIRDDELLGGALISNNSLIAIGRSRKFGTSVGSSSYLGMVAIKINILSGDTLFIRSLNQFCDAPHCIMGDNNLVYVVASESLTPNRLLLSLLDTNGSLFYRTVLDSIGEAPSIEKVIRTNDGNFLVVGSRRGLTSNLTVDMFALKFNALGQVLWNNRYNANPYSGGNHLEETPEGHYLLSGNAGSKIWRLEVDSDGNQLNSNFLYQTPSFVNFNENTAVLLTPDSASSISGSVSGSVYNYYFGKHKNAGNVKVWGGEQPGYMAKSLVNVDNSIIQYRATNAIFHLNRLRADSSVIWSTNMSNRFSARSVILNSFIYLPDESAIALGYLFYLTTNQANDFYFCRISNVGIPYDPSIIVSNQPKMKGEELTPYPNPVATSLVFKGLSAEGVLYIYDLKGKIVKEIPIKPYQRVYFSDVSKGLYLYRIQTTARYYSGKILKE